MMGLAGVTAMDTSVASVTVIDALPEVLPNVALIFAWPGFIPYAYASPVPLCDSITIVALAEVVATALNVVTVVSDELQVTEPVRSFFELSE
jgi:hypothetical protein